MTYGREKHGAIDRRERANDKRRERERNRTFLERERLLIVEYHRLKRRDPVVVCARARALFLSRVVTVDPRYLGTNARSPKDIAKRRGRETEQRSRYADAVRSSYLRLFGT